MIRPIFLLSQPRAGSTLLQRLIATHPQIATSSEPWFLLPLFLGFRDGHVYTSYQQCHLTQAFDDFIGGLSGGKATYYSAVRAFADTLYEKAGKPSHRYFLDKTPRYHLIAEDLAACFPEARFVILWRNPLAVVASIVESFGGAWILHRHRVDLYQGIHNLVEFQRRNLGRIFVLRYEDLVEDPDRHVAAIFRYLEISPIDAPSQRYRDVRLSGKMGDKKGDSIYSEVSVASRELWRDAFRTLPRRVWARRYLSWIGTEALAEAGYDHRAILSALERPPLRWRRAPSDLVRMLASGLRVACEGSLLQKKRRLARQGLGIDVPSE